MVKRFFILLIVVLLVIIAVDSCIESVSIAASHIDPEELRGNFQGNVTYNEIIGFRRSIGTVLGVVRIVGMVIAIVMLAVIGSKYMMAAPSDRADLKKYIPRYVIGAMVLFSASAIVSIVRGWVLEFRDV